MREGAPNTTEAKRIVGYHEHAPGLDAEYPGLSSADRFGMFLSGLVLAALATGLLVHRGRLKNWF